MHDLSPAENAARAALRDSVEIDRTEVALAGETVTLLRSELRHCIKDALVTATSDENIEETRQAIEKLLTIADAGAGCARPASQATRRSPDSR